MGNVDPSYGGGTVDGVTRSAIRKQQFTKVLRSDKWVRPLKSNTEVGDGTLWKYAFQDPQPAFVVNPKFGMCLIWSRETLIHPTTRQRRQYYLVTFVRAVKKPGSKVVSKTNASSKKKVLSPEKFYKVPATITMGDGTEVEYVIPLRYIIRRIYNGDSSDASTVIIDVMSRERTDRMTLEEFRKVMKARPPQQNTRAYQEAFAALYATTPEYVATHLLSSEVVVSKEAEPFMISTTSHDTVEDSVSQSIGGSLEAHSSSRSLETLHMFHPSWHVHDPEFVREFDSMYTKQKQTSIVSTHQQAFDDHDRIVVESSSRVPGRTLFMDPRPYKNHIFHYNEYIE
jgi:hypothetical protein